MRLKDRKNKGFIFAELIVGLTVLGILLTCLAVSLNGFARFNHYQLVRQRCTSAAQAQLDSITLTGKTIDEKDFEQLWPSLSCSIKKSQGLNHWEGLSLVRIKTAGKSFNKNVEVELGRYILPGRQE